jgi:hypothetical protein
LNPSVCGQLAVLIAERARDSEICSILNRKTEIVTWEGNAKGIEDAALSGIQLNAISVRRWYETLEGIH